ncbi:Oligogalacturonate-specific porin KdgM precursor [compost metagenome]
MKVVRLAYFFPIVMLSLHINQALANSYKTTVEYRHEYRDGTNKTSDRVKVYVDTGENIGFELDARYGNANPDQSFDSTYLDGSELTAFYYKPLSKNLTGLVGTALDVTSSGIVHVPFVRLNYKFDNGFRMQGRYKWKLSDFETVNNETGYSYRSKIQELDLWVGYNFSQLNVEYLNKLDFEYQLDLFKQMVNGALPEYDGKEYDTQHNIKIRYSINENWKPFFEIGNIKEDRYSDNRQTRYRIGVQYTW